MNQCLFIMLQIVPTMALKLAPITTIDAFNPAKIVQVN